MSLPTAWSLLNSCLCCPLGPGLRCCVGPWSWLWLRLGFWDVKMLGTRIRIKTQENYLCTHFLACAIGINVVGTNAWYLLHLCGSCGAHASHLLQFFHGFTPFLLWCSTFVSHAFLSTYQHTIANTKKTATIETMMFETYDPRPASKSFSTIYFMWQSMKLTKQGQLGGTMHSRRNEQKQPGWM